MSTIFRTALALLLSIFLLTDAFCQQATNKHKSAPGANSAAEFWLTDPSDSVLFKKEKVEQGDVLSQSPTIRVSILKTYQSIDGFGYALTGGSAMLINKMTAGARAKLLHELFTANVILSA